VTAFVEQNGGQLQATDSAGQEKEATDAIKNHSPPIKIAITPTQIPNSFALIHCILTQN